MASGRVDEFLSREWKTWAWIAVGLAWVALGWGCGRVDSAPVVSEQPTEQQTGQQDGHRTVGEGQSSDTLTLVSMQIKSSDGEFFSRGSVEEGRMMTIAEETRGIGFRPSILARDPRQVKIEVLELSHPKGPTEIESASLVGELILLGSEVGVWDPDDGGPVFEISITDIAEMVPMSEVGVSGSP